MRRRSVLVRSLVVGVPFMLLGVALPFEQTVILFAVLLGVAAGVYPGFAMQRPVGREVVVQWVVALVFVGLACAGAWWEPALLGVGWVLHAAWDLLHHRGLRPTPVPRDYPILCAYVDVMWGIFLIALSLLEAG